MNKKKEVSFFDCPERKCHGYSCICTVPKFNTLHCRTVIYSGDCIHGFKNPYGFKPKEPPTPIEVIDSVCWVDIVLLVLGYKEEEDIRFCEGKSCNYCGKFNDKVESQGENK